MQARQSRPQGELAAQEATIARLEAELRATREELADAKGRLALTMPPGRAAQNERVLLEHIVANVPAGIAYLDRELVYRWVNPAYARLLQHAPGDLIDRPIFSVLPSAEARLAPLLEQAIASGEALKGIELPFTHREDGRDVTRYWDFSCVPLLDDHGTTTGLLILDVDVSGIVESERRHLHELQNLQAMDRYKDEFLSVISHELRTPLNFIMGFASLLEDEAAGPLNPSQHEFVDKILNGADRMLILVNDLLDVAKIKAGKLDLAPVPTPYPPLVSEVVATMLPLARDRQIRLESDIRVEGLPCLDGPRIVQALSNLISNAIKFTPHGGRVAVSAFVRGAELITQVTDTGAGIPADQIPRLFERFQQLDMSRTRKAGGTGLGLAITKALIEAHGGRVGVISEPRQGSTFWFALPMACEAGEEGLPPARA